jgi:hypothetical protein
MNIDEYVMQVNDGPEWQGAPSRYLQRTPKQRILAALYDIKRILEPEEKVEYKDITSDILKDFKESPESVDVVNRIMNVKL